MTGRKRSNDGVLTLCELREFASFSAAAQRYIRRSLDIAFRRGDPTVQWSRDSVETAAIRAQTRVYELIDQVRELVPDDTALDNAERLLGPLIRMSAFDLSQGRLSTFPEYRFLYERLIGAQARPWLPAAFCAAASLPNLHPNKRLALLRSISEAAATAPGWSNREPEFFPEWVEKDDTANLTR